MAKTESFIEPSWLARPSTEVAPDLIGCTLVRQLPDGQRFRGTIVETEAYAPGDPGCHAYRRRTPRNSAMFGPAGTAYVYLIYGIYHCLNIVTDLENVPSAVLIRALQLESIPPWIEKRQAIKPDRIAAGPGKLCRALQIDLSLNAQELRSEREAQISRRESLWIEPRSAEFQQDLTNNAISFVQTTRIGLSEGSDLPWRWYLRNCPAVSIV